MLLHRPDYYAGSSENEEIEGNPDEAQVIVAKNRHGSTSTVKMRWDGRYAKFITIDDNMDY